MSEDAILTAAAILVWLPPVTDPNSADFHPMEVLEPPAPNPEPWWELRDAISYAVELENKHGKLPWIKVHSEILSPLQIGKLYKTMKGENA